MVRALASHQCGSGSVLDLALYVGWVCCWLFSLLWEIFLWVLGISPLLKKQHFQIPIWPGIWGGYGFVSYNRLLSVTLVKQSWYIYLFPLDTAFSNLAEWYCKIHSNFNTHEISMILYMANILFWCFVFLHILRTRHRQIRECFVNRLHSYRTWLNAATLYCGLLADTWLFCYTTSLWLCNFGELKWHGHFSVLFYTIIFLSQVATFFVSS